MKLIIVITVLTLSSICHSESFSYKWSVKEGIKTPESVYYSQSSNSIFVSSIDGEGTKKDGKGHISKLSSSGKILKTKWITGLNAPKGMRSSGDNLWVTDIDELVQISIKQAKIVRKYKVNGAIFLNDIAISKSGDIYFSDTLTSKIHVLKNKKVSLFVGGEKYESPNGLLIKDNLLFVAAWGLTKDWSTKISGRLYSINLENKNLKYISSKPLGHLDGLELDKNGNFLVSDWSAGKIYKIKKSGETKLIFTGKKGLADIGLIPSSNTILIPYMNDNEIIGL